MLFKPTIALQTVCDISLDILREFDVQALILDVDNTLTTHDNPNVKQEVLDWLNVMKSNGVKLMIVSNNYPERVQPLASMLGIDFVSRGQKPLPKGFSEACRRLNVPKENICAVGDQIFTDILGANLKGIKSIFVFPMEYETTTFFKVKRTLEKPLLPKKLYQHR
ncbi:MAG: YqeG family HAD IIIA-type phosphatase [Ruminococcus sp.]|nr:YqeG family HAD IIIA-type phosphatase [Ruminococcus sp.]MCD7800920.1 YqeG family HAD IIIA-type phosphatase [Ruminococcus sp.]